MRATSSGEATRTGRLGATATTGRDVEVADRDPEPVEQPDDAHLGGIHVEGDLLGRLAQRGRGDVGVARFRRPAREADLAAVVAVTGRALGQDDAGETVRVGVEEDQDAGRSAGPARWRVPRRSPALHPADDDRHQDVGRGRQDVGECRETLEDEVETHPPTTATRRRA